MDGPDHLLALLSHAYGAQSAATMVPSAIAKNISLTRVTGSQGSAFEQMLVATRSVGQELLAVMSTKVALERVLDQLPFGLILVTAELRVLSLNRFARELVESGKGLTVVKRCLACMDGRSHQKLEHRLQRVAGSRADKACAALRVTRGPDLPDLQLSVTPVELAFSGAATQELPAFVITVFDPNSEKQLSTDVLRELHGLTGAEADVAVALYGGRTIEDTAAKLGISINTVKTHLKHIFQKCEVRSQAELLQMLALGPK